MTDIMLIDRKGRVVGYYYRHDGRNEIVYVYERGSIIRKKIHEPRQLKKLKQIVESMFIKKKK